MTQLRVRKPGGTSTDYVEESNPLPVAVFGVTTERTVSDLLGELLVQMKIQNAHLSVITGESLDEMDIPVEVR